MSCLAKPADQRRSESYCAITLTGTFTRALNNPHLSFNVTTHFDDGREGEMPGEDEFCSWIDLVQNGTRQCPPTEGPAVMQGKVLLLDGWVPEV